LGKARERRLIGTLVVYLSTSMSILGAVNLFSLKYRLPRQVFDLLLVLLLCGVPCVVFSKWRRAGGHSAVGRAEGIFYGAVALLALGLTARIVLSARPASGFIPPGKTIAVLPFRNLSGNPEDEYFSDGVTEDIITHLSKISGLSVISRTSVMPYKKSPKSLKTIAQELGVAAILEGSVRRSGDQVRIVGTLINARDGRNLWAETYDRRMTDLLGLQAEVAQTIARELRVRLSPEEKKRLSRRPTDNIEAYTFYVKGRERYYLYTAEDNKAAIALFKKAVETDPGFAAAYAGLADAYAIGKQSFGEPADVLDEALRLADRAISLDPGSAEGFKALGLVLENKDDEIGALNAYYRAVQLNPNYAPVILNIGSMNYIRGQFDEALIWHRKAVDLQPDVARFKTIVAVQYYMLGFDDLAAAWLDRALALQPQAVFPNLVYADFEYVHGRIDEARERIRKILDAAPRERTALQIAGNVELSAGKWAEARAFFERRIDAGGDSPMTANALAFTLRKLGESAKAAEWLEKTLKAVQSDPDLDAPGSDGRYALAQTLTLRGKTEEALDAFERALRNGFYDRSIAADPVLSVLRTEPRYQEAMKTSESRLERMRARIRQLGLDR
jgi:TolB-like protein/Flp pilus assembly protein TadD